MALDPTSNVLQVLSVLRQQVASQRLAGAGALTQVLGKKGAPSLGQKSLGRTDSKALEKKLRSRIGKMKQSGSDSFELVLNTFIEGVLVAEFGDVIGQDPKFHAMLDDVVTLILEDDGLKRQFAAYFSQLVALV